MPPSVERTAAAAKEKSRGRGRERGRDAVSESESESESAVVNRNVTATATATRRRRRKKQTKATPVVVQDSPAATKTNGASDAESMNACGFAETAIRTQSPSRGSIASGVADSYWNRSSSSREKRNEHVSVKDSNRQRPRTKQKTKPI